MPATRDKVPGPRELDLLRWVARHGPVSVGEAAEGFGGPRGLARTTVQTLLERLRKKGRLRRRSEAGRYRYSSPVSTQELLRGVVRSFVEGPLAGSVSPFVAYLAEAEELSDRDLEELEQLLARLQGEREER